MLVSSAFGGDKAPPPKAAAGLSIQGKIVRLDRPDRVVVRTSEGKDVILYTNKDTRYLNKDKAIRYEDLPIGTDFRGTYRVRDDRFYVDDFVVGAPVTTAPAAPEGTVLEGTVVKVVGEDQVIVRTGDGKEVVIYVQPKTTYQYDDRPAKFVDLTPGVNLRVNYDERDRRFMARSLHWRRR